MAIYKRGTVYWYNFVFSDEHVQQSTKQGNPRVARQMEAAHKTALAKGEMGLEPRKAVPTLKDFSVQFKEEIRVRSADRPLTISFYESKLARLLDDDRLKKARLDKIDENMISLYVQNRRNAVSPATVNRELATLRRLLRLAHEWHIVQRVPRIRLLAGERIRDFVLSHQQEQLYLTMAPQPLHDIALLILDSGLRIGEVLSLEWRDIHLEPAEGARLGYLQIRAGKSKNAKRTLSLTKRIRPMLEARRALNKSGCVFTNEAKSAALSVYTIESQHAKLRNLLKFPRDFVLHGLRHTFLTRLGASNADAFTLMKIAGHSTLTISQRYVHPTPETMESAFERLEGMNERAEQKLKTDQKQAVTTSATTVDRSTNPLLS